MGYHQSDGVSVNYACNFIAISSNFKEISRIPRKFPSKRGVDALRALLMR